MLHLLSGRVLLPGYIPKSAWFLGYDPALGRRMPCFLISFPHRLLLLLLCAFQRQIQFLYFQMTFAFEIMTHHARADGVVDLAPEERESMHNVTIKGCVLCIFTPTRGYPACDFPMR